MFIVYRQSEEPHENRVVPFTPARTLSYSHSNGNIGLPTPESLPRRRVVVSPPSSTASSSEVTSSCNDDGYSGGRTLKHLARISAHFSRHFLFFRVRGGFSIVISHVPPRDIFITTQVTELQTSLTAAENALDAANRTTQTSQERCLGMLEDLRNARMNIADLQNRAARDASEKDNLQHEIGHLKDEVSRLQSGVEQMTQIARGQLIPL
ncbi:hypothetical protein BDR07DRAFT_1482025 [Suillus spraguei]|nr:hypothetical protein BDR07DRAFT_1482025 [Suillus spraguei]